LAKLVECSGIKNGGGYGKMSQLESAYAMINILQQQLKEDKDKNHWHLNALKTALYQLKIGVDRNIVINDIEQYMKDLGT
jgi:hypothetical protein